VSIPTELRCRAAKYAGLLRTVRRTPSTGGLHCDDCQAFAHQLGRADLLDAQAGSDIVQVAPASAGSAFSYVVSRSDDMDLK
jgi:hypothetical protein